MVPRRALVVTFDRLPATILGCYGNEWIETPQLDRLASAGLVADQCFAARVGPQSSEEAFAAGAATSRCRQQALQSVLFQESGAQVDFSTAGFDHVETLTGDGTAASKPDTIPLAVLVRAALVATQSTEPPSDRPLEQRLTGGLSWVHARGLELPATPPAGFAELYHDEFEDRGVQFDQLSESEQQHHPLVAAGMMSLFDHWLGELIRPYAGSSDLPTLIVVAAAQGNGWQPLPNSLGALDDLRGQAVQTPLIVRAMHDERFAGMSGLRTSALLSTADLGLLLDWWFQGDVVSTGDFPAWIARHQRGRLLTHGAQGACRVSTVDWGAIFPPSAEESVRPALFHKPEDAWEVNNVAETAREVVETLRSALNCAS